MCPEWSARVSPSMEVACWEAVWLHWKQMPQSRQVQEKTQIKIMIPKKSNFFVFFFFPTKSTDLWSFLDWGSDPSEHSVGFLCDLIKTMYQLQATIFWIIAQVPPFKGVIISKAIQFWKTAFLIRDISVFSKDRFCQLSFKVCWWIE